MRFFAPREFRHALGLAMGFNLMGKAVGYLRQVLVAYCFGVSRGLDVYFMTNAIAAMFIFSFGAWFDQLAVPRLVAARESEGAAGFRELSGSVFALSLVLSLVLSAAFIGLLPLSAWVLAHGFTPKDRSDLMHMAPSFLPWTLLCLPYSALGAILKSLKHYDAVIFADLTLTLVSTTCLFLWHPRPEALPLTLAAGYLVSSSLLFALALRLTSLWGSPWSARMKPFYRNFIEMFVVNQVASLGSAVDRFFQSYLLPGSISAFNYSSQALVPFSELIAFKELFVVPLSSTEGRRERLQRLMHGILLLTIPVAVFLFLRSDEIIGLLFQRGHFDSGARVLTSAVFALWAATLVSSSAALPLNRMFLITDNLRYSGIIYLCSAALLAGLDFFFIFFLELDVRGLALALVVNNILLVFIELYLLDRIGLRLRYLSLLKYALYAGAAASVAAVLCGRLPALTRLGSLPAPAVLFTDLALQGAAFFLVIGIAYWPIRDRMRKIVYAGASA